MSINSDTKQKFKWKNTRIWLALRKVKRGFFRQSLSYRVPKKETVLEGVDDILRKSASNTPLATILTPTTGSPYLAQAMESVQNQSFRDVVHLIVVDGVEFEDKVRSIVKEFDPAKYRLVTLPFNTGKNGMNGHRVYAAFPFLINSEYIFFLDEDNWLDEEHVASMVNKIGEKSLDWAFSFRKIYTESGEYVCEDNCESIGNYPTYSGKLGLVDTNCYGFRRSGLIKAAPYWYHPLGADRYFFHHLKKVAPNYRSTGMFTTNYRLSDSRPTKPDFYCAGNEYMQHFYNNKLPWLESIA